MTQAGERVSLGASCALWEGEDASYLDCGHHQEEDNPGAARCHMMPLRKAEVKRRVGEVQGGKRG